MQGLHQVFHDGCLRRMGYIQGDSAAEVTETAHTGNRLELPLLCEPWLQGQWAPALLRDWSTFPGGPVLQLWFLAVT